MASDPKLRPYSYVAYIDEAGDDGLRTVRPIDPNGASEWLILSAVVIDADREGEVSQWMRDIRETINHRQSTSIHFQRLGDDRRRLKLCECVAQLPLRCFVVVSNKKNMRAHVNTRAQKVPSRNWFYCWMSRLLLKRVTAFCRSRNRKDGLAEGKVKFEFSTRGGMSYPQFRAYMHWLKMQSRGDALWLKRGDLAWDVVDIDLVESYNHTARAGLQFADVVASAFFQAVNLRADGTCLTDFAKALAPRMCPDKLGLVADIGVKAMPSQLWRAELQDAQKEILAFYGYRWEDMGGRPPGLCD